MSTRKLEPTTHRQVEGVIGLRGLAERRRHHLYVDDDKQDGDDQLLQPARIDGLSVRRLLAKVEVLPCRLGRGVIDVDFALVRIGTLHARGRRLLLLLGFDQNIADHP